MQRSVPFLSVPSGFGNLFAHAFGHPHRADRVLDALERGELVYADVGVRDGELFLCHESFGPVSGIQERVEASLVHPRARWRRWVAYYRGALRYLRDTPLTALEVTVDGRVVARDAVIATVANVKTYDPSLELTPTASPVDGLFDVCGRGRRVRAPGPSERGSLTSRRRTASSPLRSTACQLIGKPSGEGTQVGLGLRVPRREQLSDADALFEAVAVAQLAESLGGAEHSVQ